MTSEHLALQRAPFFKRLWFRFRFGSYLPYLGAGIRIARVTPDFSYVQMKLTRNFLNQNYLGTHFGGSLYAMCDPVYMMLLIFHLGPDYIVIDHGAEIEFLKVSRKPATADFRVTPALVESIKEKLKTGKKIIEFFEIDIISGGEVIARVKKSIYIRKAGRLKNRRWG